VGGGGKSEGRESAVEVSASTTTLIKLAEIGEKKKEGSRGFNNEKRQGGENIDNLFYNLWPAFKKKRNADPGRHTEGK